MCSAPAAKTFVNLAARSAADVLTGGAAEIGGNSKKIGEAAASIIPTPPPAPPAIPTAQTTPDTSPQQIVGGPTDNKDSQVAAAKAARRAAAMRAGIMSTIGASLGNIGNTTPNMPKAYASGMKVALGQ